MKLLHVIATPRRKSSTTLGVAQCFLEQLRTLDPGLTVTEVDLFGSALPDVSASDVEVKHDLMTGRPDGPRPASWHRIEQLVEQFLDADTYLVSAPMWNLSVPYALKQYIDCLVQPGYTFRYDEDGVAVPLVTGRRMVCVTSRGGDFGPDSPMSALDFQEPYLRAIFGFIGITDLQFVHAQPVDVPGLREAALATATGDARETARRWAS